MPTLQHASNKIFVDIPQQSWINTDDKWRKQIENQSIIQLESKRINRNTDRKCALIWELSPLNKTFEENLNQKKNGKEQTSDIQTCWDFLAVLHLISQPDLWPTLELSAIWFSRGLEVVVDCTWGVGDLLQTGRISHKGRSDLRLYGLRASDLEQRQELRTSERTVIRKGWRKEGGQVGKGWMVEPTEWGERGLRHSREPRLKNKDREKILTILVPLLMEVGTEKQASIWITSSVARY